MSDLRVFKNTNIDWVIAASPDDADAVVREHTGDLYDDDSLAAQPWVPMGDEEKLSIMIEDEGKVAKSCGEWVRAHGRGFLASTEW